MNGYAKNILEFHCPRWEELPDIGLYMDQVVSFIDSRLRAFEYSNDAKVVSSTMINNYVKQKAIIPPDKKKYSREHIARLLMICKLKVVLPIASIAALIGNERQTHTEQEVYDHFCAAWADVCPSTAQAAAADETGSLTDRILRTALQAQVAQSVAEGALELLLAGRAAQTGSSSRQRGNRPSAQKGHERD